MLLALTSASGCWKIRHLHVSFTQNLVKNFVLIRLSQPKRKQQTSLYQCYNLNLFKMIIRFVFRGIRRVYFLRKTRKKSKHTKFLLSHIEPHSPVKTCRLSRWTCQVFKYAGINTKMLKPNSKGKTFNFGALKRQEILETYTVLDRRKFYETKLKVTTKNDLKLSLPVQTIT